VGNSHHLPLLTGNGIISSVAALKNNQTLKSLKIFPGEDFPDLTKVFFEIIAALGLNTSLNELCTGSASCSRSIELSLEEGKALSEVLRYKNFSLSKCPFSMLPSVGADDQQRITRNVHTVLDLNENGRRYLVEGRSKERGVALLAAVAEDLECIFFHLLENPSLVDRTATTAAAPGDVKVADRRQKSPDAKRGPRRDRSETAKKRCRLSGCDT